jgi:LAO/AO transport system kinase
MTFLSRHDRAYIRASPSSGTLGGVARNTSEAITLCEAAGYDVVIVETVGVGQSETLVAEMVDMFALLLAPGGGDELQGLKKGIVELADILVINKADGDLQSAATLTQLEYVSALKLLRPRVAEWRPKVLKVSSVQNTGINECWQSMLEYYHLLRRTSQFDAQRRRQRKRWLWRIVTDTLMTQLKTNPEVRRQIIDLEMKVMDGELTPRLASDRILAAFRQQQ